MKLLSCIGLATATLISACSAKITNSFGIFLTVDPVDPRITAYGKGDWSSVKLAKSPVISDADIISYDFTNHFLTLKPEALQRLPHPAASGTPFVVTVHGQRIYLGVFMTSASSFSRAVPSIMVDGHMLDTNLPPNTFHISRSYGGTLATNSPDPRDDRRIKSALEKAHEK